GEKEGVRAAGTEDAQSQQSHSLPSYSVSMSSTQRLRAARTGTAESSVPETPYADDSEVDPRSPVSSVARGQLVDVGEGPSEDRYQHQRCAGGGAIRESQVGRAL
ncbi:hypothetical protein EW145_g8453, partial [Phellinidium pouzarii]